VSVSRRGFLGGLAAGAGTLAARGAGATGGVHRFPGHPGRYGLLHDTTLCVGCRSCEVACKQVNGLPPPEVPLGDESVFDRQRRTTHEALTVVNRYREASGGRPAVYRKHQCMHCNEPACVSVCLVSALTKSPEGPVLYDPDVCMGCRYCMTACPYYALAYEYDDPLTPRVRRCTMCHPRLQAGKNPGCADACPTGAITFGRREELLTLARARVHKFPDRYLDHVFGEHEFGGTSWLTLAGLRFGELGLLDDVSHVPLPERTRGFLSLVPLVLTMWPGLLLGFYAFTRRREVLGRQETEEAVADAVKKALAEAEAEAGEEPP